MQATIDGAGRIVVPKSIRDAMRLSAGQRLEMEVRDGRLEIEVAVTPMRLVGPPGHAVAVPIESLPPLTADQVRETLEQTRR